MRLGQPILALALGLSITSPGMGQQQTGTSSIGYPSVAAALDALRSRGDVKITNQGGWAIVDDRAGGALWSFTPPGHPAHPAAIKRTIIQKDGGVFVDMSALCQAEKAPCDKLVSEFRELNEKIRASMNQRSRPSAPEWAASEQQKNRATDTLSRFLTAIDESRYKDAYDMFTPSMKSMMSLDQFTAFEADFKAKSGGQPTRSDTRITWYKDPPRSQAPGVYAAIDIKCQYRNINSCGQVVILHEQPGGEFLVMRQEMNFVDKATEEKLRERQQKREGS